MQTKLRLKVEINTREHFTAFGFETKKYEIQNLWFQGGADIQVYTLEELLGTKLRALFQRKKGRDLFDLYIASKRTSFDKKKAIHAFLQYMSFDELTVTRAQFEENLFYKSKDLRFINDMNFLFETGKSWDIQEGFSYVLKDLIPLLSGEPWRG